MPRRRRSASNSASASRQSGLGCGISPPGRGGAPPGPALGARLSCCGVGLFFIDPRPGQVATQRPPAGAGITGRDDAPPPPWHRIQGTIDASTMWYAVLRRRERGVFIGTLVLRHSDHHALLLQRGWEEVPPSEIGVAQAM